MPNWKKVIVSGSDAILNDVTLDGTLNIPGFSNVSSSLASLSDTTVSGGDLVYQTGSGTNSIRPKEGSNTTCAAGSVIGGGASNDISFCGICSGILSGENNQITASIVGNSALNGNCHSIIAGGHNNTINVCRESGEAVSGRSGCHVIVGGECNEIFAHTIAGGNSFIGGGCQNKITGSFNIKLNTIVGGYNNFVGGVAGTQQVTQYSNIVGGQSNYIENQNFSNIVGGFQNKIFPYASGQYGCMNSIVGGCNNQITGSSIASFIGGGEDNIIRKCTGGINQHNSILGGKGNEIKDDSRCSNIIGHNNTIQSSECSILIGSGNSIGAGVDGIIGIGHGMTLSAAQANQVVLSNLCVFGTDGTDGEVKVKKGIFGTNTTTIGDNISSTGDIELTGSIYAKTDITSSIISASNKFIGTELSSPTDLTLDADGADILLKDGGTEFGRFKRDTSDFVIKSAENDKDIIFRGVDNSVTITALTLDMSDGGKAKFAGGVSGSFEGDGSNLTGVDAFPFTGDAQITGSLLLSGSLQLDYNGNGNMIIGSGSGEALTTGTDNIIFGNNAAQGLDTGADNIIIGKFAAKDVDVDDGANLVLIGKNVAANGTFTSEDDSVCIGTSAGQGAKLAGSVFIGHNAGASSGYNGANQSVAVGGYALAQYGGSYNVAIGYKTLRYGYPGSTIDNNIAIGYSAMEGNSAYAGPRNNIAIGFKAMQNTTTNINIGGGENIAIGYEAARPSDGTTKYMGTKNIVIGYQAGQNSYTVDATHNIIIGPSASLAFSGSSDTLVIASGSSHLISGSFATGDIIFYGTASAPYFVGDGSGLTNLPAASAGSTSGRVVFTTTAGALTTDSGFDYNSSTNQLTVESLNVTHFTSSFITSSQILSSGSNILGDDVSDTQTLVGTTKITGSARITGNTEITGSFLVVAANSATAPTTQSLKIDSDGYFYHLGYHDGNNAAFANNLSNTVIGNDISNDGDYYATVIGYQADVASTQASVGIGAQANVDANHSIAIGAAARTNTTTAISLGYSAGGSANTKGINIGKYARGEGAKNIVLSSTGLSTVSPTKANTFGIYMTDDSPNFEIEATGSSTLSGSSFTIEKSGSTVFEVIGSEGTLFSVDDDLDGTIFTANDRSGLPVLEASASGEVYIGKAPQSLYTTAVISSTTAATTQSIFGLSTSSYGGAFFDYTVQSGSNARAGSIMSVWNGSNISFTETTTTDIGDTTDFNVTVHISQSQAQIASHATRAGYNIKTIIRSI